MSKGARFLGWLLLLGVGCAAPAPHRVDMTFQATNTADRILVVEGETNLPSGSPLKAELRTRDGQVLLRDSSVVRQGKFYFDFDLASLSGLSLYEVNVLFDPQTAPLGVRRLTGLWGEALEGPGVREVHSRRIVSRKLEVLLSTGGAGEDWEGRDFEAMEISERTRLIAKLESLVEEKSDQREAKLALARAYIAADPRELASGTRADALLKELADYREKDSLSLKADTILEGIKGKESKAKLATEQRQKISRGDKYRNEKTIRPGQAMGGFALGMSYGIVKRHFKLKELPNFSNPDVPALVRPVDLPGLELRFNSQAHRLVSARTTSPHFVLPEGFGVGSLLQELQQAYGKEAIPTPSFRHQGTRADGRTIFAGTVVASGLEFEIVREIDPVFGMPVDRVVAITVFLDRERAQAAPTVDPSPELPTAPRSDPALTPEQPTESSTEE